MGSNISELPLKDKFSYSRLDCFKQCKLKYKLKYLDGNYSDSSTLPLRIGTIVHKALELKYENKLSLDEIWNGFVNGYVDGDKFIDGLDKLKEDFAFDFYDVDAKTQMSMEMKVDNFKETFFKPLDENDEWKAIGLEVPFEFVYNNKVTIRGFIDRVDQNKNTGDIRVIDYKTSKKLYSKSDLATPMQMLIYTLACKEVYGKYPAQSLYDMVFLQAIQESCTKGYIERGTKKLDELVDSLIAYQEKGKEFMPPSPSVLCHWCDYCETNENASEEHKHLCPYFLKWTRQKRDFGVNKVWIEPVNEDENDDWDW